MAIVGRRTHGYTGETTMSVELTPEDRAFLAREGALHLPRIYLTYTFDGVVYDRRYDAIDEPTR